MECNRARALRLLKRAWYNRRSVSGRLAQLGERRVRNAEVGSSSLLPSTTSFFLLNFPFCPDSAHPPQTRRARRAFARSSDAYNASASAPIDARRAPSPWNRRSRWRSSDSAPCGRSVWSVTSPLVMPARTTSRRSAGLSASAGHRPGRCFIAWGIAGDSERTSGSKPAQCFASSRRVARLSACSCGHLQSATPRLPSRSRTASRHQNIESASGARVSSRI
jgi:hypothetical protein